MFWSRIHEIVVLLVLAILCTVFSTVYHKNLNDWHVIIYALNKQSNKCVIIDINQICMKS